MLTSIMLQFSGYVCASVSNSTTSLLKEIDVLSTIVQHKLTSVVMSDVNYDTN